VPYTVAVSFDGFIENISISGNQADTAQSRCQSIVDLLSNEFDILEAFPMGSLMSGTSLKSYADADVMLVLHYGKHVKHKTPTQLLQDVRDKLSEYNTRMAKKNGQAVTLYFKTWPNVDVVPACRVVDGDKFYCYELPNINNDSWIQARTKIHIANMARLSRSKIDLIKMIKEWNRKHSSYLSSFHIEIMLLSYPEIEEDYAWHIFQGFEHIYGQLEQAIPSPSGLGGNVDDYLGFTDRIEARKRLERTVEEARAAWSHAYNNRHKESIEAFGKMFGERFPSYG